MNFYVYEDKKLISLIKKRKAIILDVGCGNGRYLIPLSQMGHRVIGIDANETLVRKLRDLGYEVYTPIDFDKVNITFGYIIMSHIIEHIQPSLLISFMDKYIGRLRIGGELIIATPLLYDEFYDDYDHIKPYTPKAISILYSDYEQQQTKPIYRLKLKYVWFRRWPKVLFSYPNETLLMRGCKSLLNKLFYILYKISFGVISRTTGWIGVFERVV